MSEYDLMEDETTVLMAENEVIQMFLMILIGPKLWCSHSGKLLDTNKCSYIVHIHYK